MSKIRNIIGTAILLLASTAVALVACEFLSRFFLKPVDYLKPRIVPDAQLQFRIEPGSGGHDEWGFRNKAVPEKSDIVALGDSQTYGVGATSGDAWPAALARASGRETYNLALGGYGPLRYLHLLREKALALEPNLVIVGLYYGNDIFNAFGAAYRFDHWDSFRSPSFSITLDSLLARERAARQKRRRVAPVGMTLSENAQRRAWAAREWLAMHSVLYRASIELSPLGRWLRSKQVVQNIPASDIVTLKDERSGVSTAFAPRYRRRALDLRDPRIREGVRVTQEAFLRMRALAASAGVDLLVVLIPTKERVYERYIEHNQSLALSAVIDELLANERSVDAAMKATFDENGIEYVDTLPPLQEAAATRPVYPSNVNSHPTKDGYAVIAETINRHLSSRQQR